MCTLIEYNITKTHQKLCGKKQMNFQVIFYLLCGYQMVAYKGCFCFILFMYTTAQGKYFGKQENFNIRNVSYIVY